MTIARCSQCGTTFHRGADEGWKRLCVECFQRKKRAESGSEIRTVDHSEAWRVRYLECNAECGRLRAQVNALLEQLAAPALTPLLDELREHLPRLLLCCHPDKHNNSPAATKVTQYLLQLRARLNA